MIFIKTISAIVITLVRENSGLEGVYDGKLGRTESFVINQFKNMPDYILFAFHILFILFNLGVLVKTGRRFSKLGQSKRLRVIQSFRTSHFSFIRDFVNVFDSLILFSLTEREDAKCLLQQK